MRMIIHDYKGEFTGLSVYVVSNLGFYESVQIRPLFDIVENWCHRMTMIYGGGLAVGSGPMVSTLKSLSLKKGPNKNIGKGFEKMAAAILKRKSMENYYDQSGIPRMLYMKAAHMLWGKSAKENGFVCKRDKVRGSYAGISTYNTRIWTSL